MGSRRKCEDLITSGRVTIDGKRITKLGQMADPTKGSIYFDGEPIKGRRRYIIFSINPEDLYAQNVEGSRSYGHRFTEQHRAKNIYCRPAG